MKRKIDLESLPLKDWKKEATMFQDDYTAGAGTSWLLNVAKAENEMIWEMIRAIEEAPTLTPQNEWVRVEERLPQKDGWYLVYAPGYWGNSKIYGLDGLAYSNFKHNYKVHWGIERGTGRGWPGIVTHWMPLPAPPDRRPPEGDENA